MSLFRLLGMGGDDDDFYSDPSRQMNAMMSNHFSMMGSLMESPFALMGPGMSLFGDRSRRSMFSMEMMPLEESLIHPFRMIDNVQSSAMQAPVQTQMYFQSNVVHMTNGPDGRPEQVYQAMSTMRSGPGGVKETVKAVTDSRSGVKKMQIGHHIGERGHVVERERNYRRGTEEEREEYINIDEEEADEFENNFRHLAHQPSRRRSQGHYHHHHQVGQRLALPPAQSGHSSRSYGRLKQSRRLCPGQPRSAMGIVVSRQGLHRSLDSRKKRPHEADSTTLKRKNQRIRESSEPIPVVEVPDSDSEECPPESSPKSKEGPIIVEVID